MAKDDLTFAERPVGSPVEVVTINVHLPHGVESEDIEGAVRKGFSEKGIDLRYFSLMRSSDR